MEGLDGKITEFLKTTGSGWGWGRGGGRGSGWGSGSGSDLGLESFNGIKLYAVDSIPTAIISIKNNIAKGFTVNNDLNTTPCYIVKQNNLFAHGTTIKKAVSALQEKLFKNMPEDERIDMFLKAHNLTDKYSARDLYEWHYKLTGSCEFGRDQFAQNHGIDLEKDAMTVEEFIELTKNSYCGDIIIRMSESYKDKEV